MRLLIAEDERILNKTLAERLAASGYAVDCCFDGEDALYYIENTEYDGIIMDIMMPKLSGIEVLKKIRKSNNLTPVLILTAKDSEEDIIAGLDTGANDYLTKPFSYEVLCARIRAMFRAKNNAPGNVIWISDMCIDTAKRLVKRGGIPIELSSKEYAILQYLAGNKNIVVSKDKLLDHIWNYEFEGTTDIIKVYIHHLRKKIDGSFEKKLLHTVKNSGYVIRD